MISLARLGENQAASGRAKDLAPLENLPHESRLPRARVGYALSSALLRRSRESAVRASGHFTSTMVFFWTP